MRASGCRSFLSGGGVTGELMRSIDWSRTPVGPVETWPSSLRTTVGTLLHSRHPMFLWWGPELIQFYNDAYLPSFGVGKHPGAMGRPGRETWPETWSTIGAQIDGVMSRGEATWHEDALVPIFRNGTIEDVYWTYGFSPVFDEAGCVGGVLVVCTETTERVLAARRVQAALAEAERERARMIRLFSAAPAGICVVRGPTLIYEFANEQYRRLAGQSDLLGRPLFETLPVLKKMGFEEQLREALKSGKPLFGHEVRVALDQDGQGPRDRYFTFLWSPMPDASGSIDGLSAFIFDVTDHVLARLEAEDLTIRLEQAIVNEQIAREAAEVANRAKDDFLATVSHELRTPLTAMLGWARMLLDGRIPSAKRERALTVIERNALAQTRLIDDLLDVSRVITGTMQIQSTAVDLVGVIEAAIDSVRPTLDAKGIELHVALEPVTATVLGDPNRLRQVISNLLANATKFTPREGRIQVTLASEESRIKLRVDDNGQGISGDFLPRVFERFKQAETGYRRSQGGLGLGLAISRHLVELHRGSLSAHSEGEGRGASFVLTLPLAPVVETQPFDVVIGEEPRVEDVPALEGLRVLVVDDEEDVRQRVAAVLSEHGAIPIAVQNAGDALDALAQYRPDVLVSDIAMPGEDGYSFIRRVRRLPAESGAATPAAAFTVFASAEDRAQALVAGYQMHIPKPAQAAELVAAVASLARLARSMK